MVNKIYATEILFRGKYKHISSLSSNSDKKITIKCPTCSKIFERYFKILSKSGNFECQCCTNRRNSNETTLEIGTTKNRLTYVGSTDDIKYGLFNCTCGTLNCKVLYSTFISGGTKSCGCLKEEYYINRQTEADAKALKKLRGTGKYLRWRVSTMHRDLYTCQKCKVGGGDLVCHHIEPFETATELRYTVSNGVTLCRACHDKYHTKYKNVCESTFSTYLSET